MKKIKEVQIMNDYKLLIIFNNNEKRIKDMKPYLEKEVFSKLKDINFFNTVKISHGTICWGEDIDLCADSIYETSSIYEE